MKGTSDKRAIFLQIGKSITQSKPISKKEGYSFFQNNVQSTKNTVPLNTPHIYQNSMTTKRKISLPYTTKINTTALVTGMNDQFLYYRKQNHLNTCFNQRKNKLKQISKENKNIHKRLNSQKSIYSSTDLNKSFQSTNEIKKRLSQSKLSQRMSSSRSSSREKLNSVQNKRLNVKKKQQINIKAASINDAKRSDIQSFHGLFSIKPDLTKQKDNKVPLRLAYSTTKKLEAVSTSLRQNYGKTVPAIKNSIQRQIPKKMGGILHRIAEVMYSGEKTNQSKTTKGYLKPKKTFIF